MATAIETTTTTATTTAVTIAQQMTHSSNKTLF